MSQPTHRLLLLLLLSSVLVTGCTTSLRYLYRKPPALLPPPQAYETTKPSPLTEEDQLDQAEIDSYLASSVEKSLDSTDLANIRDDGEHPLTIAIAQWLGTRYRWGGKSRKGIDCSGFVNEVFEQMGIDIPRNSRELAKIGAAIDRDSLRYGDILTFARRKNRISHVGIYLGDGRFAHSSRRGVTVSTIESGYWHKRYVGARRISIPNIETARPPVPTRIEDGEDPSEQHTAIDTGQKIADNPTVK